MNTRKNVVKSNQQAAPVRGGRRGAAVLAPTALALAIGLAYSGALQAATLTWDGGAFSQNLFDTNNWNPNNTPDSTDDLTIGNPGSGTRTVVVNQNGSVRSLQTGTNVEFWVSGGTTLTVVGGTSSTFSGTTYLGGGTNSAGTLINQASNLTIANLQNVTSGATELRVDGNGNVSATAVSKTGSGTWSVNRSSGTGTVTFGALTFTGGTINGSSDFTVSGATSWVGSDSTVTLSGSGITTLNGALTIGTSGDGSTTASLGRTLRVNNNVTLNSNSGDTTTLSIQSGGGVFDLRGDWGVSQNSFGTRSISNAGTFQKSAGSGTSTIAPTFSNSGTIDSQIGTLVFSSPVTGTSGTVRTSGSGAITLNGASNTAGTLDLGGSAGTRLTLGSQTITVSADYLNNFGTGNTFSRYAGVSRTSGAINAAGGSPTTFQQLSVDGAAKTASNATLAMGNVHVGDSVTKTYLIYDMAGVGGVTLRGAIQGSGLDTRLSGTGVDVAGSSWTATPGASPTGVSKSVTFTGSSAGALTGQSVTILNNFANTNSQTLTITGAAYRYAAANTISTPVNLGIAHVGGSFGTSTLSVSNTAANDGYSEGLNASIGSTTGDATGSGSFNVLAAGSSSTALSVGLGNANMGVAGAKAGTVTVNLVSDGTGTSGLGTTNLAGQVVTVTGQVNNYAQAAFGNHSGAGTFSGGGAAYVLDLGTILQGTGSAIAGLDLQNIGGTALYTDWMNGSFNTAGIANFALTGFNSFSNLAGGGGNALSVSLNNGTAGSFDQTLTLTWNGQNAGGYIGANQYITLELKGVVQAVPEPHEWAMMLAGLGMVGMIARRRRRAMLD